MRAIDCQHLSTLPLVTMQTTDSDNLFRSDAELAKQQGRQAKLLRTKTLGDPINLTSKPLGVLIRGSEAWAAESGFILRRFNLDVCSFLPFSLIRCLLSHPLDLYPDRQVIRHLQRPYRPGHLSSLLRPTFLLKRSHQAFPPFRLLGQIYQSLGQRRSSTHRPFPSLSTSLTVPPTDRYLPLDHHHPHRLSQMSLADLQPPDPPPPLRLIRQIHPNSLPRIPRLVPL